LDRIPRHPSSEGRRIDVSAGGLSEMSPPRSGQEGVPWPTNHMPTVRLALRIWKQRGTTDQGRSDTHASARLVPCRADPVPRHPPGRRFSIIPSPPAPSLDARGPSIFRLDATPRKPVLPGHLHTWSRGGGPIRVGVVPALAVPEGQQRGPTTTLIVAAWSLSPSKGRSALLCRESQRGRKVPHLVISFSFPFNNPLIIARLVSRSPRKHCGNVAAAPRAEDP
jgi:hypothetical protein